MGGGCALGNREGVSLSGCMKRNIYRMSLRPVMSEDILQSHEFSYPS